MLLNFGYLSFVYIFKSKWLPITIADLIVRVKRELLDSEDLRNVFSADHNIHGTVTKNQVTHEHLWFIFVPLNGHSIYCWIGMPKYDIRIFSLYIPLLSDKENIEVGRCWCNVHNMQDLACRDCMTWRARTWLFCTVHILNQRKTGAATMRSITRHCLTTRLGREGSGTRGAIRAQVKCTISWCNLIGHNVSFV